MNKNKPEKLRCWSILILSEPLTTPIKQAIVYGLGLCEGGGQLSMAEVQEGCNAKPN